MQVLCMQFWWFVDIFLIKTIKTPYSAQCYLIMQLLNMAPTVRHKVMSILVKSAFRMREMAFPIGHATNSHRLLLPLASSENTLIHIPQRRVSRNIKNCKNIYTILWRTWSSGYVVRDNSGSRMIGMCCLQRIFSHL